MSSEVWGKKRTIRLKTIYWSTNEPFTTYPFDATCHKVQTPTWRNINGVSTDKLSDRYVATFESGSMWMWEKERQRHRNTTRYLVRRLAVNYHLQGTARHSQVTLRHTDSLILYKLVQTPANSRRLPSCCVDLQYINITIIIYHYIYYILLYYQWTTGKLID